MPRALVIGAGGMVGGALTRAFRFAGWSALPAGRREAPGVLRADLLRPETVREALSQARADLVLLPAAVPHVDHCELHPEETRAVNVEGTAAAARECAAAGLPLVFFSSDYVFDGRRGGYAEDDRVEPINAYGRQKVEAETAVLAASGRNLVVRTSGVYGWEAEPKNFVLQLRRKLSEGREVLAATDMRSNPTYSDDLGSFVRRLAEAGATGVVHVCGAQTLTRLEFGRLAARIFGLDGALVRGVPAATFPSPTRRPLDSSLSMGRLRALLGAVPLGADEGLAAMKAAEPTWRAAAAAA